MPADALSPHAVSPPVVDPRAGLSAVAAGLVVGVVAVILAASFAALIFSGPLSPFLYTGLGIALFSVIVHGAVVALTSSNPSVVAIPQDRVVPILALMAGAIVTEMPPGASLDQAFVTVLTALVLSTLVSGLFLGLVGTFRLGGFIRFIPYPVIGGFLAGSGWLLVAGAFKVMTATNHGLPGLAALQGSLEVWLPGAVFAVTAVVLNRSRRHPLVLPLLIVVTLALFYGVILGLGIDLAAARSRGWLLAGIANQDLWHPLGPAAVGAAHWPVILDQAGTLATVVLVSGVSVLLTSSAMELTWQRDMDLNRELRGTGLANLVAGLGGGITGFHSMSLSALALHLGGRARLVGLTVAAVAAVTLFLDARPVSYFPVALLGGLLMYMGLTFLVEWVVDARRKLSRGDYTVVLLILLTVGLVGYLEGIAVGVVAAVILFVLKYSQVDVIKHQLSGVSHRSNVDRPPGQRRFLDTHGERLRVMKLQGYIFFGSANRLLEEVRRLLGGDPARGPAYIILDFQQVTGMDSSAAISFSKIARLARQAGFGLVFTGLAGEVRHQLGPGLLHGLGIESHDDLDHGMEWCEERLLQEYAASATLRVMTLVDQLSEFLPTRTQAQAFVGLLERCEVARGDHLLRQGEAADTLYFIESGRVSVYMDLDSGASVRLRTMGGGSIVGELGLYLGGRRNASAVADSDTVAYRLRPETLARIEAEAPELAAGFHRFIARLLAERVVSTNRTLQALLY